MLMPKSQIANLLLAPYFKQIADDYQQALRDVVAYAVQNGIPVRPSPLRLPITIATVPLFCLRNLFQVIARTIPVRILISALIKKGVFHTEWLD